MNDCMAFQITSLGKTYFAQRSSLKQHAVIQTYDKTLKCEQCIQRFNRKDNLTRHMLIHSCKKDLHCDICKKTFTLKFDLKHIY